MLTLIAAGVTVVVALSVVGVPVVDACNADPRGLVACVRDMLERRFDLSGNPAPAPGEPAKPSIPAVAEAPVPVNTTEAPKPSATAAVAEPIEAPVPAVESEPTPPATTIAPAPASEPKAAPASETPAPTSPPAVPVPSTAAEPEEAPASATAAVPPPDQAGPATSQDLRGPFKTGERTAASETGITVAPPIEVAAVPETAPAPATEPPPQEIAASPKTSDVATAPPAPVAAGDAPRIAAETLVPAVPQPADGPAKSDGQSVANIEEPSSKPPEGPVTVVPILPPTIDAVEIDGDEDFVAGDGPAGAMMRLYVDGKPVGESPVEGGRWLVSGPGLLSKPSQELRVEAVDPKTGQQLSSTTVTFEIELPKPDAAPIPAVPTQPPAPEPSPPAAAPSSVPPKPTSEPPAAETSPVEPPAPAVPPATGPVPSAAPEPAPAAAPARATPTENAPSASEQPPAPAVPVEGSVVSPPPSEEAPSIQALPMAPPAAETPAPAQPLPAKAPPPAPEPHAPAESPSPAAAPASPAEPPPIAVVPTPAPEAPAPARVEPNTQADTQAAVAEPTQPQAADELPEAGSPSVAVLPAPAEPATTSPPPSAEPEVPPQPSKPAVDARLSVPELKPAPAAPQQQANVAAAEPGTAARPGVIRLVPFGRPQDGRFISGKAIIRRGDTLWDIARRYYGHGIHYKTIFRANKDVIRRPGRIYPGQVFDLPLVTDD